MSCYCLFKRYPLIRHQELHVRNYMSSFGRSLEGGRKTIIIPEITSFYHKDHHSSARTLEHR